MPVRRQRSRRISATLGVNFGAGRLSPNRSHCGLSSQSARFEFQGANSALKTLIETQKIAV